jgi:hypothetical protein
MGCKVFSSTFLRPTARPAKPVLRLIFFSAVGDGCGPSLMFCNPAVVPAQLSISLPYWQRRTTMPASIPSSTNTIVDLFNWKDPCDSPGALGNEPQQLSFLLRSTDTLAVQRGHQTSPSALRLRTSRLHQSARHPLRRLLRRSSAHRQQSARRPR